MVTTIKFAKCRDGAIIPSKRVEDAGMDIYACFDEDYIVIQPHETKLIPTGLKCAFDTDYALILKERGSTGTKGMAQRCGVIDSGFRNEIFVPITNTTEIPVIVSNLNESELYNSLGRVVTKLVSKENLDMLYTYYPASKAICQGLLVPVPEVDIEEYTEEEIMAIPSERGEGMLGSSGK